MTKNFIWILLLVVCLVNCGKDSSDNDNSTHFQAASMGNAPRAVIVADPQTDRIYFFGGLTNPEAICYDYQNRQVVKKTTLDIPVEVATTVCLGFLNGNRELYLAKEREKVINVYNASTLGKIDSVQLFDPANNLLLRSISSDNDNIIFVSPYNNNDYAERGVRTFDRANKAFIDKSPGIDPNTITYTYPADNNTTVSISLGRGDNGIEDGISLDVFDQQGNFVSNINNTQIDGFYSPFVRLSAGSDFFISGDGMKNIYAKVSLQQTGTLSTKYRDMAISDNGSTIYALSSEGIDVIEYPSLNVIENIALPEDVTINMSNSSVSFHLFIDDGRLIITNTALKNNVTVFWLTFIEI